LNWYNTLLPGRDRLQAALLIEVTDQDRLTDEMAPWRDFQGQDLCLAIGANRHASTLLTCRPEDLCIGAAHWVQFPVDLAARQRLADFRLPAFFDMTYASYRHQSPNLNDEVRQSLLDDLALSDRDS
jgi:hypothetical protein